MKRDLTEARERPGYRIRPEEAIEPEMSRLDWEDLGRGVELFNKGAFWESHEAWEEVWKRRREPSRIFFQGLIQLAAAYHQLGREIHHGLVKHLRNSHLKLGQFQGRFLGIDIAPLLSAIENGLVEAERLGKSSLDAFDNGLVVQIDYAPIDHQGAEPSPTNRPSAPP